MKHAPHLYSMTLLLGLPPIVTSAQGVHTHHAFQGVCDGYAYYDEFADSVVWSTGFVGWMLADLAPENYGFTAYLNGQVVNQGAFDVELVGWHISLIADPYSSPGLVLFTGQLEVPHCADQIFDGLCCDPDPSQTSLLVLQDGEAYQLAEVIFPELNEEAECAGCEQVQCDYSLFGFYAPPGHLYTVGVNDQLCAGLVMADTSIITPSCGNLELVIEETDTETGQSDGSVAFIEAIPDTTEPFAIAAPVTGTAFLYLLPDGVLMGMFENAASAMWEGLAQGDYLLVFMPDAFCQTHSAQVHVGGTTDLSDRPGTGGLRIYPAVADRHIQVASESTLPVDVRIMDIHGRVVLNERTMTGPLPLQFLVPGTYLLLAQQGDWVLRTRFLKQ